MRTRVCLISMPWSVPLRPSIQSAALKAWCQQVFGDTVACRCFSAHLSLPFRLARGRFVAWHEQLMRQGEELYLLARLARYGLPGIEKGDTAALLQRGSRQIEQQSGEAVTPAVIDEIARATEDYARRIVIPWLDGDAVNIVGFTVNFAQVHASAFMARALVEHAPVPLHFLFGGSSMSYPRTAEVFSRLAVPGHAIIGEGELKLQRIVSACLSLPEGSAAAAVQTAIDSAAPGTYPLRAPPDLYERDPSRYETEIEDLKQLPLPDYSDYYTTLRGLCADRRTFEQLAQRVTIMLEGSRGCFASCDFCSLLSNWSRYRHLPAGEIAGRAVELVNRWFPAVVAFGDNVCDSWAAGYARHLGTLGVAFPSQMELRAHHPEQFWTRLSLIGVDTIQVGVEALSAPLLEQMGKGTSVIQNLRAEKHLAELQIQSGANLLTHHPRSTTEDVRETRRILEQLVHIRRFHLARTAIPVGSRLYADLTTEQKRAIGRDAAGWQLPRELFPFNTNWRHELTEWMIVDPAAHAAWDELCAWYDELCAEAESRACSMTVLNLGTNRVITDRRRPRLRQHVLGGALATVFDAAHAGLRPTELAQTTALAEDEVDQLVSELAARELVLIADGFVLSLPLRPRDVLLRNALAARPSTSPAVGDVRASTPT